MIQIGVGHIYCIAVNSQIGGLDAPIESGSAHPDILKVVGLDHLQTADPAGEVAGGVVGRGGAAEYGSEHYVGERARPSDLDHEGSAQGLGIGGHGPAAHRLPPVFSMLTSGPPLTTYSEQAAPAVMAAPVLRKVTLRVSVSQGSSRRCCCWRCRR